MKDPAGDYLAGASTSNEHYGLDVNGKVRSCGAYVVYPIEKVKENIAKRSGSTLKKFTNSVTLAEANAATLDEAAPRPALAIPSSASADPDGLLVIGRFTDSSTRPYQLWIEDSSGRRTGWLSTGEKISDIPDSYADVEPILPSDPDESDDSVLDATSWPFMTSVNNAKSGLKVFVYGNQDTAFSLEVVRYQNGQMISNISNGSVVAGETKNVDISAPPPLLAVPDLIGQTQANATSILSTLGLTANVKTASSSTVSIGTVISQNPISGEQVASGTSVELIVSSGPAIVPGDLNGDGAVNCSDLVIVKNSFGKRTGQAGFNAKADLNKDGIVNVLDLSFVSRLIPIGTKCS